MRIRLQYGGGAYVDDYSTLTMTGGSSIDGNTAGSVSTSVSLSLLSSWLICPGTIDARSLRKRDFAMLEFGGDAAIACASARSTEEAST